MATQGLEVVILAVILGTLFAIVYSLRVLVLMERRIARIDKHLESLVSRILIEGEKIKQKESKIEQMLQEIQELKKITEKKASSTLGSKKITTKKVAKKVVKKAKK